MKKKIIYILLILLLIAGVSGMLIAEQMGNKMEVTFLLDYESAWSVSAVCIIGGVLGLIFFLSLF